MPQFLILKQNLTVGWSLKLASHGLNPAGTCVFEGSERQVLARGTQPCHSQGFAAKWGCLGLKQDQ